MSLETRIKLLTNFSEQLAKIVTFMKRELGEELTKSILEQQLKAL